MNENSSEKDSEFLKSGFGKSSQLVSVWPPLKVRFKKVTNFEVSTEKGKAEETTVVV